MNTNPSANKSERRPDETIQPRKPWRKPALAELDLEATETGKGFTEDLTAISAS